MAPKRKREPSSSSDQAKPGDVSCDFCSEPKLKASKSCLVCLSSFCESHLQPHLTVSGLKRHQLMEPVPNLEERTCPTHQRPLELFCNTDEKIVCLMCSVVEHKSHELISLEEACERRRSSLLQTQAQTQHMVEQRRQKVQEIQSVLQQSEAEVDRERAAGLKVFSSLMESVQRRLDVFLEQLQEKQKQSLTRAQELLRRLEQEICELEKSSTEPECLSRSQDHLHFLQHCPAPPAGLQDWSGVSFEPQTCEGSAARALSELQKHLTEEFRREGEEELRRVRRSAVEVTLDPLTAHPKLVLSQDLKRVHHSDQQRALVDSGRRFSQCCCVLGKQRISGRFYFEVQVEGKTEWDVGVVRESISTKGKIALKPKNGQWVVWLRSGQYSALDGRPVPLSLRQPPRKVGVFVDYRGGVVSFYDAEGAELLYSFTDCSFEESLVPFLSPCNNDKGRNSAPLVLTALRELESVTPNSVKPECVKPECVKSESVKSESVKSESVKPESVKPESVKSESVRSESVRSESVKSESVESGPSFVPHHKSSQSKRV